MQIFYIVEPGTPRFWRQVFQFSLLQFSWTTRKGELCDGTNTVDARNGTNRKKGERAPSRPPLDLPFFALFTVDARGGAADRSGKESRERNKLSRSIDCPPSLCALSLSCCSSGVGRARDSLLGTKVTDSQWNFSGFWGPRARARRRCFRAIPNLHHSNNHER